MSPADNAAAHLIQQRLKEMMVGGIDQRHVNFIGGQGLRGVSPPKPPPTMTTFILESNMDSPSRVERDLLDLKGWAVA